MARERKKGKYNFEDAFANPYAFTNERVYLDRQRLTREQAAKLINDEYYNADEEVKPEDLKEVFVRFGFPPMEMQGYYEVDPPCWYGPVPEGRGAMPVWEHGA